MNENKKRIKLALITATVKDTSMSRGGAEITGYQVGYTYRASDNARPYVDILYHRARLAAAAANRARATLRAAENKAARMSAKSAYDVAREAWVVARNILREFKRPAAAMGAAFKALGLAETLTAEGYDVVCNKKILSYRAMWEDERRRAAERDALLADMCKARDYFDAAAAERAEAEKAAAETASAPSIVDAILSYLFAASRLATRFNNPAMRPNADDGGKSIEPIGHCGPYTRKGILIYACLETP